MSCRKTDVGRQQGPSKIEIVTKFFKHNSTDTTLNAIIASIKRQNDQRDFIERLTKTAGYPIWDKAKVSIKDDKKQVFIPFVLEKGIQTKALLLVRLSGKDTLYHLMYGAAYKKYGFDKNVTGRWTARQVFNAFAIFDKEIFGHEKFTVKDDRLLGADKNNINNEPVVAYMSDSVTEENARVQHIFYMKHTTTWMVCGTCPNRTSTFPEDCCNATYYEEVTIFWFDDMAGGTGPEWGWYPPEGGGGYGGDPCPGCNWDNTNPCEEQDPNQPQFPCDQDWQPIVSAVKEPFHINDYDDTIGIGSGLENVYPCVASFIRDSFANINSDPHSNVNYLAQLAGGSVFEDSAYMHLTFDTSTTNTTEHDTVAVTSATNAVIDPAGNTHFFATINFNGWFLRNETKEYMVCSIIHEIMHAVFKLRWEQYKVWLNSNPHQGTIDSFYMKSHFPIYWEYWVQNGVPSGDVNDHEIMATDYFNFFHTYVSPFYNPSAPQNIRDSVIKAMSYTGLSKTTAWKFLPSLGMDTCKYKNMLFTAQRSLIGSYHVGSCPNFNAHYSDSLKLRPHCN